MNNLTAVRYRQRLDNLFKQIGSFSGDPELQSHWAKYLCVLTSGFLETSVRAIYSQYTKTKAAPYVANFVDVQLKYFQNPKMDKILELTKFFSPEWEYNLRNATDGEAKDAVDSIVANRNRIAHGESVGITYSSMQRYYQNAIKVIKLIDEQCKS
ncbi:MAG: HEPN domain-containing protein [Candidatus Brocadiales bacterium]